MDAFKHKMHSAYKGVAEAVMTTRTVSAFAEKGVVTPEEFVIAGDFLVSACPTWSWAAGEPKMAKTYLPLDKQYLITRNVPCMKRAAAMEEYAGKEQHLDGEDDGWVAAGEARAGAGSNAANADDLPDIGELSLASDEAAAATAAAAAATAALPPPVPPPPLEPENIPDMDDFEDVGVLLAEDDFDDATAPPRGVVSPSQDHILKTRTYDMSITYDKYYQTPRVRFHRAPPRVEQCDPFDTRVPRPVAVAIAIVNRQSRPVICTVPQVWLNGFDESRRVLDPAAALQDVSADHAQKTVTIDPHPHTGVPSASIHPCRHAVRCF